MIIVSMKKNILFILSVLLILGVLYLYFSVYPKLEIINGYAAKTACSCHFSANRSLTSIKDQDLAFSPLNLTTIDIDNELKMATSTFYGFHKKSAIYKKGLGCILLDGIDDHGITYSPISNSSFREQAITNALSTRSISSIDSQKISDLAFADSSKTRALLILHHDTILYEEYAEGFDSTSLLLGWSMTKSITNALIGIFVKKGKLSIDSDHLFPNWSDERQQITLHQLLTMTSGLDWEEEYSKISDATTMLYSSEDIVKEASDNLLANSPGTHWYYSSGTTNLLCGIIRANIASHQDYLTFPRNELFDRIGITSALIETDEAGNFVGSSFGYATSRDWARLGLLYLNDGTIDSLRILPQGWVEYSTKQALPEICEYGAQLWLNRNQCRFPNLPENVFWFSGYQGQYVMVIPDEELVIVRLGLTKKINIDSIFNYIINATTH